MQYALTRVHEKSARFHISPPEYAKTAPDFAFPNRDAPKPRPVLHPNLRCRTFRGVCNTPLHGYVQNSSGFTFPHTYPPKTHPILPFPIRIPQNQPGFRPKPSSRGFSGRMQYAPTRVREKFDGFHISAHEYAKNAPDFTLPNKDIPKSCPILDPNLRRGTFRGVCFCAPTRVREKLSRFHISTHVPAKNAPDFIFPNKDTP